MNLPAAPARRSISRACIVAACLGSVLTSCTKTTDPDSTPAITELTGPSAVVSVPQGFFAKSVIVIKRGGSFDGEVQLTAQGVPQGMLVSFAPSTVSSVGSVSEMTITALTTLSPGAHSFTVRASGTGVASKTLTVSVMVTVPAFTVTAAITTANVAQGSTQSIPVTISREGGFTGIVGLAVLGLPAGVTATFSPPAIESGATNSTLTFSAPLTVQTGVTTVTLRASAQGLADKTIPIALTVASATTPAILLSASPVFLEVDGGLSIETALTLQRFAGFGGVVNVSVDALPANLTVTAPPFAVGSNTTALKFNVSEFEAGVRYDLTLRASGTGISDATTRIAVQTRLNPQIFIYFESLLAPTPKLVINRGENGTIRLSITRYREYNQLPVVLTVTGVPSGATTNLPATIPPLNAPLVPPATSSTQTFDIVINVSPGAVPGVYTIGIRGEMSTFVRTATIELTVK